VVAARVVEIAPPPSATSPLAHEVAVDVLGCAAAPLASVAALRGLGDELVATLGVVVLAAPQWHRFPDTAAGPGGVTGLYLLSESHLALHSWPERAALLVSVCCCRPLVDDDVLAAVVRRHLDGAEPHGLRLRFRRGVRGEP
jgi:S-adenosylmethionine/arginine decarboxylase-like enzyme